MNYIKKLAITTAFIAFASLPAQAQAVNYVIDTKGAHAFINFKINHLGFSWLYGRFNDFSGEFSYDAEKITDSKVSVSINTNSIDSNHAERDKHLSGKDFLNTSAHPKSEFVSTKIVPKDEKQFELHGNLTLNGVTKEIIILAEKTGEGSDPWGGHRAGFSGSTTLALKDFGINYDLGPAATHVYLELAVEGIRQK